MLPGIYDLNLYRGDTSRFRFVIWHDEAKTQPYILGEAVVMAQIRDRPESAMVAQLVCAIGVPNIIDMTVPAPVSATLERHAVWDLQVTWPSGDVLTMVTGGVFTTPDVTRMTP